MCPVLWSGSSAGGPFTVTNPDGSTTSYAYKSSSAREVEGQRAISAPTEVGRCRRPPRDTNGATGTGTFTVNVDQTAPDVTVNQASGQTDPTNT